MEVKTHGESSFNPTAQRRGLLRKLTKSARVVLSAAVLSSALAGSSNTLSVPTSVIFGKKDIPGKTWATMEFGEKVVCEDGNPKKCLSISTVKEVKHHRNERFLIDVRVCDANNLHCETLERRVNRRQFNQFHIGQQTDVSSLK